MNKSILLLLLLMSSKIFSQHEKITDNWKTISINDNNLGKIDYHVYKNKISDKKPLIVYLQGSKNFPLYSPNSNGRYSTSTTLGFKSISNDYHIVLISKPNTPFVDSIKVTPSGRKYYPLNEEYREKYGLDWRANSADKVINDALKKLNVDSSTVIVWGHSEGSQVAPAVAIKNKNVTHVISMMGNSLNHLYDFILMERVSALNGEKSNEEAQSNIDSLYAEYEKIYNDPKSTTKEWFGETYYKWSSFTLNSPIENMLKLDIPILYVAGGNDHHSILNMDYAKLEFLRKGKDNLTYKVFPNCDHFFMETKTDGSGKKEWIDHLDEVNGFALKWVNEN
ncbi:alpha/beta hydrolase [Flavobacteriaceae bacterium S0825]|uniref:alpha/beta hydrolase n=1 Tax=Gaetbulibacter sp. S0825 TaxID=2720084 RepID=UPI001431C67D|nr:alpha/beta hydrolase [Gaetbulibacter sp. S0825]MCK0108760.1 alpha/beta hydrolase [Flavobacteriaceae bacterium S0825]NIX64396.1 alpha/beta hydrolase [Gaetbulibacter sp. S0825]